MILSSDRTVQRLQWYLSAADSKDHIPLCACSIAQWCPTLCHPMDCSPPGFSVRGIFFFFRQEYWSGLLFPTPEDLPDPKDSDPISCISYISLQTRLIHYYTVLFAFFFFVICFLFIWLPHIQMTNRKMMLIKFRIHFGSYWISPSVLIKHNQSNWVQVLSPLKESLSNTWRP